MRAQFSCAGRCQANAIFMVLDLSRRADAHARLLASEASIIVRDRESDPREVHPAARMHNPFARSEEHTSELQSLMRISYAVFCLKKKKQKHNMPKEITRISHTQRTY